MNKPKKKIESGRPRRVEIPLCSPSRAQNRPLISRLNSLDSAPERTTEITVFILLFSLGPIWVPALLEKLPILILAGARPQVWLFDQLEAWPSVIENSIDWLFTGVPTPQTPQPTPRSMQLQSEKNFTSDRLIAKIPQPLTTRDQPISRNGSVYGYLRLDVWSGGVSEWLTASLQIF